jgi:MoaA/NifB/PqqE/SkfB family radical SAM enzyme
VRIWRPGRRAPDLEWVQVEVTSRCNAACTYCPRAAYAPGWLNGDLEVRLLRDLLENLRRDTLVHLQGWGEPLLHPAFVEMVEAAKHAGHRVAATTNGMLLTESVGCALAGAGLDILGVSLVRVDGRNDAIRVGTSAAQVIRAVGRAARLRESGAARTPRVHVAYLMLRSQMDHLPEAVRVLGEAGADQVVVSSLDLVADEAFRGEALWDLSEAEQRHLLDVVRSAEQAATVAGTELVVQVAAGGGGTRCPENAGRSAFVGFDGAVLPCVMAAVPVRGRVTHWGPSGVATMTRVPLGDLHDQPLDEVWRRPAFRRFRRRLAGWGPQPPRCADCAKPLVRRLLASAGAPDPSDLSLGLGSGHF